MMKVSALFALAAGAAMALAMAPASAASGKTLAEIHGASWPKSADGFVTKNQCLQCHGPYEKLAKQTEGLDPNPHWSHLGAVNCEDCHKADKAAAEPMCNTCHNFDFKPAK